MTGQSTDGRYSARNSSVESNIDAVAEDTRTNKNSLTAAMELIDESIRTLPDSIEVLAKRADRKGIKDLLALTETACSDAETFRAQKKAIDDRFDRLEQERPKKPGQFADKHHRLFKCGSEYIELNQQVMRRGGDLVAQIAELIDPDLKETPTEEAQV